MVSVQEYRFYLREKLSDCDSQWSETLNGDPALIRDYFRTYLYPPRDREYPDLCQLPDLNEETLMDSLRARFQVCLSGSFTSGSLSTWHDAICYSSPILFGRENKKSKYESALLSIFLITI